jgi:hypothetical protein
MKELLTDAVVISNSKHAGRSRIRIDGIFMICVLTFKRDEATEDEVIGFPVVFYDQAVERK